MVLIKIGGGEKINFEFIAKDLTNLKEKYLILHGANYEMKRISKRLGIKEKFIESPTGHISRYTDKEAIEVFTMVYAGLVNKKLVSALRKEGINAIGLSGCDGGLFICKRKEVIYSKEGERVKVIRDSYTGNVEEVNSKLLITLINNGYVPVISPPALSSDFELINFDNDRAMGILAKALKIKEIVMLIEEKGYLSNLVEESSIVKKITLKELDGFINNSEGRMKKKLLGIKESLMGGVEKVYLGDGRIKSPISLVLEGKRTEFTK